MMKFRIIWFMGKFIHFCNAGGFAQSPWDHTVIGIHLFWQLWRLWLSALGGFYPWGPSCSLFFYEAGRTPPPPPSPTAMVCSLDSRTRLITVCRKCGRARFHFGCPSVVPSLAPPCSATPTRSPFLPTQLSQSFRLGGPELRFFPWHSFWTSETLAGLASPITSSIHSAWAFPVAQQ